MDKIIVTPLIYLRDMMAEFGNFLQEYKVLDQKDKDELQQMAKEEID